MGSENVTQTTGQLDVGGSSLYYEVMGAGYPLVLIHDGLVDLRVWDEQFFFFADQYRVIRYDRRGYGRSERPLEDYSNVSDLHRLLASLEVERAALMGVSAGGMVGISFALAHPDLVSALVLVGTAVGGFQPSAHMLERGMAAIRPLIEDDDVEQTIENWVNDPYLMAPANKRARQRLYELLTSSPRNLYDPHYHSFREPGEPALRRLDEIQAPTLLIVGEADAPDNHAVSGAVQVGIRDSKRVVLPDAGHLAQLEQPQAFNQLVAEFLGAVHLFDDQIGSIFKIEPISGV
jgi:pimeloyl-ACP methyl ester carboxylesterase